MAEKKKINESDALREMCYCNGIDVRVLKETKGLKVECLELFLNKFTQGHLRHLHNFSFLTHLTIIGQSINQIEGVTALPNLCELWFAECKLKRINGLEKCTKLQRLYLYSNHLEKIENLEFCLNLQILWLASNQISSIQNIESLVQLQDFNVADNKISLIGNSLKENTALFRINLSGNPIYNIQELMQLSLLPRLKEVYMEDPQYSPCPVTLTCNYNIRILNILQNVYKLDKINVTEAICRENFKVINKKAEYHRIQIQNVKHDLWEKLIFSQKLVNRLCEPSKERVRALTFKLKQIELLINSKTIVKNSQDDDHSIGEEGASMKKLQNQHQMIIQRLRILYNKLQEYDQKFDEACTKYKVDAEFKIGRMVIEFRTFGNVSFEIGMKSYRWYGTCEDLINARFCEHDYGKIGINGVRTLNVIRIRNRVAEMQMDKFEKGFIRKNSSKMEKHKPEYLLLCYDGDISTLLDVIEYDPASKYEYENRPDPVMLTNSLYQADRVKLELEMNAPAKKMAPRLHRFAYVLVCKVYHKPYIQIPANTANKVSCHDYSNVQSVYHPILRLQSPSRCSSLVPRCYSAGYSGQCQSPSLSSSCECNNQYNLYYVFDSRRILPQYIVHVEYLTKVTSSSPFLLPRKHSRSSSESRIPLKVETDSDIADVSSYHLERLEKIYLNDDGDVHDVKDVSIINRKDWSLNNLGSYSCLVNLSLSFIGFTDLSFLPKMPSLESLNVSFNKIKYLTDLPVYPKLNTLDLSWNELSDVRQTLLMLMSQTPELKKLKIKFNPWKWHKDHSNLQRLFSTHLKQLKMFDGITVDKSTSITFSSDLLLDRSYILPRKFLFTLNLAYNNKYMADWKIDRTLSRSSSSFSMITVISLSAQNLLDVDVIGNLVNLKHANLSCNYIQDVKGLEKCANLKEISIEDNCLTELPSSFLRCLKHLTSLNISLNFLKFLPVFESSESSSLKCLMASGNRIRSVVDVSCLKSLQELYLTHNDIRSYDDVEKFYKMENLEALDVRDNLIAKEKDFRLHVIFHSQNLCYLNGTPITFDEITLARDRFANCMSLSSIAKHVGHCNFMQVTQLDLQNCSLKHVELGDGKNLINLKSLNLENNELTSFSGLTNLTNLSVLCVNYNRIKRLLCDSEDIFFSSASFKPVMENLNVLHIGYNNIIDLEPLQFHRMPSLKALFLQGNQITSIDVLSSLTNLQALVLDRNKIKSVSSVAFRSLDNLLELYLEENRIQDLSNFHHLYQLERLFLGFNMIKDIQEVGKLTRLKSLVELSLISNPVCRKYSMHQELVKKLPNLMIIDGMTIVGKEHSEFDINSTDQEHSYDRCTSCTSNSSSIPSPLSSANISVTDLT
ncbi:LRRC9 (predicted) [Pycnogonum litorale]